MTRAEEVVKKVAGREYLTCYPILICAVDVVYQHLPTRLRMKDIVAEVAARNGSSLSATYKALTRAAEDLWDHGSRPALEEVYGYPLALDCKPTPKELTMKLAEFMAKPVTYRVWKISSNGKYGIAATDPVTGKWLAVAPFRVDRERIESFVQLLNRSHTPLDAFEESFAESGLLESV